MAASGAGSSQGVDARSIAEGIYYGSRGLLCVFTPGLCVAEAVTSAGVAAGTTAGESTASEVSALAAGGSGIIGEVRETIVASRESVAEGASAVRFASVAATTFGVLFLVIVLSFVAWYAYRQVRP